MAGRRDPLVLLLAAMVLMAPSLVLGNLLSHSSPQNFTFAEQFTEQFRAGVLYPRWLPDSFEGLGSATFYFYPPLAFWVTAVIGAATFGALPTGWCLSVASLLLLWASGLAMRAWLRPATESPRFALWGALAYMAAPYHLLDHYHRGAFAEFAAYAVLPLVMLSVRRIAEGRPYGVPLLAASYAALPLAHLPTSLLISLTALPLYVLYRGWRLGTARPAIGFFARCLAGGVLGLGLAALYLVPALTLQRWIPATSMWAGSYRVELWFLLTPQRWPPAIDMMLIIVSSCVAYAAAAIGVVVLQVRRDGPRGWQSEASFWSLVCLLCIVLISGAIPWFWLFPFVAHVQFPWRLMIVIDFAAVTAMCLAPWAAPAQATSRMLRIALILMIPAVALLLVGVNHRVQVSLVEPELPADMKHFQPAGFPQNPRGAYAELGLEPVKDVPTVACTPTARTCRASALPFGELAIEVDADQPTAVVVRRFAYPFWRTEPQFAVSATEPWRLVTFTVPAGRHAVRLVHQRPMEERIGWAISAASLLLLAAGALISRYTSARNPSAAPAR